MTFTRRAILEILIRTVLFGGAVLTVGDDRTALAVPAKNTPAILHLPKGGVILFQGDSITDGGRGRSLDPNHIFGQDYAYLLAA